MIVVTAHKGHSGKSVFEWRVYSVSTLHGRTVKTQLAKCKTREAAEAYATKSREAATNALRAYVTKHGGELTNGNGSCRWYWRIPADGTRVCDYFDTEDDAAKDFIKTRLPNSR